MTNINLDPSIIDQDALRKQRRKKMLIYAALPVAVFVLAGLFFIRPGSVTTFIKGGLRDNNGEGVIGIANTQKFANIIEPYIAYYNSGTAYLSSNKAQEAERDLRKSLDMNPPMDRVCQIRVNLSYSIELRADKEQSSEQASYLYNMAQGVILEDNCASQQEDLTPRDKMAQSALKRIDAKIAQVNKQEQAGEDPDEELKKITDEDARNYSKQLLDGYTYRDNMREDTQRRIYKNQQGTESGFVPPITW